MGATRRRRLPPKRITAEDAEGEARHQAKLANPNLNLNLNLRRRGRADPEAEAEADSEALKTVRKRVKRRISDAAPMGIATIGRPTPAFVHRPRKASTGSHH